MIFINDMSSKRLRRGLAIDVQEILSNTLKDQQRTL